MSLKLMIIFALMLVLWLITSMNPMQLNMLWFVVVLILSLIFGLPFAIMQRRHDLTSAIGAHTIVDLIRFCIFGAQ